MMKDGRVKSQIGLPKRIGGVRVPKKLRKAGAKLIAKATSPLGLELIAAGLSLAAGAADAAIKRGQDKRLRDAAVAGEAAPEIGEKGTRSTRPAQSPRASNDPHEIGVALGRMAEAALAGLLKPKA